MVTQQSPPADHTLNNCPPPHPTPPWPRDALINTILSLLMPKNAFATEKLFERSREPAKKLACVTVAWGSRDPTGR